MQAGATAVKIEGVTGHEDIILTWSRAASRSWATSG